MGIRLLLADDHRMVREGIKRGLLDHGFDVVGESADGDEVVRMAKELTPDIVLLSTNLPGQTGVDACREMLAALPRTRIVMLAPHADVESFTQAMQTGAAGYLVKANALSELATALRLCASGETVIAPQMKSVMLGEAHRSRERSSVGVGAGGPGAMARGLVTKREEEVLQLIADGWSTPEVASEL